MSNFDRLSEGEKYLGKIELMDIQINNRWEDLQRLYSMRTKMTTIFSLTPGTGSGNQSKIEDLSIKILELESELNRKIDRFVDFKKEAMDLIDSLNSKEFTEVLSRIYFKYMSIDDVAYDMGVSTKTIRNRHNEAIQAVEAALKEKG